MADPRINDIDIFDDETHWSRLVGRSGLDEDQISAQEAGLSVDEMRAMQLGNLSEFSDSLNTAQKVGMSPIGYPFTDLAGLAGDAQMYYENPELITGGNLALSGLGLLPFVPPAIGATTRYVKNADELADLKKQLANPDIEDVELISHPAVLKQNEALMEVPSTTRMEGFGSEQFAKDRQINIINKSGVEEATTGYERAIQNQYRRSGELAWIDDGLEVPANYKVGAQKKAVIMIGAPASGKSTISNPLARKLNARIIDPDDAKKILPEYQGGVGGNAVHPESKVISQHVFEGASDAGENMILPTIGHSPEKIRNMAKTLQAKGYTVDLVHVSVSPENVISRMLNRYANTGKFTPTDYLRSKTGKPTEVYNLLKQEEIFNGYAKIDNNPARELPRTLIEDTAGIFDNTEIRLDRVREPIRRSSGGIVQNPSISKNTPSSDGNDKRVRVQRLNSVDKPLIGGRREIQ